MVCCDDMYGGIGFVNDEGSTGITDRPDVRIGAASRAVVSHLPNGGHAGTAGDGEVVVDHAPLRANDASGVMNGSDETERLLRRIETARVAPPQLQVEGVALTLEPPHVGAPRARDLELGLVNMAEKLRVTGRILSAHITRSADWWFVSIQVDMPDAKQSTPSGQIGIDLGLNRLATLSDGSGFENQKPLRSLLSQVKRLSRSLSRKQKDGKNREKARRRLARLHDGRAIKIYFLLLSVLLTVMVGLSRIHLGVHWPTDVLAGWAAGAAWALLCWGVAEWLHRRGQLE